MLINQSLRLLSSTYGKCSLPRLTPIIALSNRGIKRAQTIVMREKLPRYKKDTYNLPPLTDLMTKQLDNIQLNEAIELRTKKLNTYKEYLPSGTNVNYLEALFNENSNDIDQVLKIIDENLITLNSFHVAISFEVLSDLMEANLCDPMTIIVSPEFKRLCQRTIYKIRFFECDEVLKLLKCLSNLNTPEDTLLVQAGLQMARHHINDFNYDELVLLSRVLESFKEIIEPSKSLLVMLKKIAPRARERQIKEKLYTPSQLEAFRQLEQIDEN